MVWLQKLSEGNRGRHQEVNMNIEIRKKNHVWKENNIAFTQKPKLEDNQVRNQETERLFRTI